jgi:glycosyltransferase involved in cell wall biosynthesis
MKPVLLYFGADASISTLNNSIGFHRRNTHILKALGASDEIHLVVNVQFVIRQHWWSTKKSQDIQHGIMDVYVTGLLPNILPLAGFFNKVLMRRHIEKRIRAAGQSTKHVLCWCYWPSGHTLWQRFWHRSTMVFDADHNIVENPHDSKEVQLSKVHQLGQVLDEATLFISSSRTMNEWAAARSNCPVLLTMNGIDTKRFEGIDKKSSPTNLTVGYVGQLSKWMDLNMLESLIKSHPHIQFKIAGPDYQTDANERLGAFQNVVLYGRITPDQLPAFLSSADVGLSLYRAIPALDVNSMKIYEYLAAHLPVIALKNHDHLGVDFDNLLDLAEDQKSLSDALASIAKAPKDPTWHRKVDEFLARSSWENRVAEVIATLKALGKWTPLAP